MGILPFIYAQNWGVGDNLPKSMTLYPLRTNSWPKSPRATDGVLIPWTRRTLSPSSGPHSYTRMDPYGVTTSRPPGRASSGYGRSTSSCSRRAERIVVRGEGIKGGFLSPLGRKTRPMDSHVAAATVTATIAARRVPDLAPSWFNERLMAGAIICGILPRR